MESRNNYNHLQLFISECKSHDYYRLKMILNDDYKPWQMVLATAILDTYREEMKHDLSCMSWWKTSHTDNNEGFFNKNMFNTVGIRDFYLAYQFAINATVGGLPALNDCLVAAEIKAFVKQYKQEYTTTSDTNTLRGPDRDNMINELFDLEISPENLRFFNSEMELHFKIIEDSIKLLMDAVVSPDATPEEIFGDDSIMADILDSIKQEKMTQKSGLAVIIKLARNNPSCASIAYHSESCFAALLKAGKDDFRSAQAVSLDDTTTHVMRK